MAAVPDAAEKVLYVPAAVVLAEGARIVLMTCLRCGAVLLISPQIAVDPMAVHSAWHEGIGTDA